MRELSKFIVLFLVHLTHHFSLSSVTTTFDKYFPASCQDPSIIKDGEYYIYPDGLVPVHVHCDVSNGGWTTVFHKTQKTDFFNRTWTDYLYGFGDPGSDYWAGLANIRNLVLTEPMILRIELSNSDEDEFFIEYESFYVGPEETGFVLHVGNRTRGNLMDTFSGMSRAKFFTHDRLSHGEQIMRIGDSVVTVNLTHTSGQLHHANFRGAWWYHHEASHSVCLTCNPKSPFEGNWQQHSNLLTFSKSRMMVKPRNDFRPSNCYDIYSQGGIKLDGIYNIYLNESNIPTQVYCEMEKGGWTRILNRIDRLTPAFDRMWDEYAAGFGEIDGNYWLGLRAMQLLTYQEQMTLRIEVASQNGRDAEFIEYTSFLVFPESQYFKVVVNASSRGTLYDWMWTFHNNMVFVTKDSDSNSNSNCASENLGGWWFNQRDCYRVCLTCAKLTHGQYSAFGSEPSQPSARKDFMKMLIRPTEML